MAVLMLTCLTMPFSTSIAFATSNVTNNTYNNVSNANATIQNVTGTNKTVTNVNQSVNKTQATIQTTVKNNTSNVTKVKTSTSQAKSNSSIAAGNAQTTFTSLEIDKAAAQVQSFVATNHRLPNYVTIDNQQISLSQFLELMSQSIVNDNLGLNKSVTLRNVITDPNPTESIVSGSIYKAEYVSLANNILSFINANGRLPNYATTSLGKISMQNLIYSFSKILNFQGTNNRLPNYVSVVSWSSISSSSTGNGSTSVTTILNTIGQEEAKFADVQGVTYNGLDDAGVILHYGYGDCWADSSWLYNQLSVAGIQTRIMGYANAPASSVWYEHAWVQINIGKGWVDWNYAGYNSQHHGNGGGYSPFVLINPGHAPAEIGSTGY